MEETIIKILRALHFGAGGIALIVAPIAMVVLKGSKRHRFWGKLFFSAMVVVTGTALLLSILRPNLVMATVAVFSFHMIASGYRSLYHKKLHEGQRPETIDWLIQGSAGLFNSCLFLWGAMHVFHGHGGKHGMIFLVFGAVGLLLVLMAVRRFYKRSHDKQEWLYGHMIGFLGGYIATLSAFSVVNLSFIEPTWLQWLWPTIIGAPAIAIWVGYYHRKFVNGKRPKHIWQVKIKAKRRSSASSR